MDYTVIHTSDLSAMRSFYETVLGFRVTRELSPRWVEYNFGAQTFALAGRAAGDPTGPSPLQLAFRVPAGAVTACADALEAAGVALERPVTDHAFGHRTVFFRDPDGNLLEIYAEL